MNIRRKLILCLLLIVSLAFVAPQAHAQSWKNKLKSKVEKAAKGNNNSSDPDERAGTNARAANGNNMLSPSEREAAARAEELGMTDEEAATLLAFYKPLGRAADHFPAEFLSDNLQQFSGTKQCASNTYVDAFEQLDWPDLSARMAQDATTYPAVFAYYGIEEPGRYADMPYGGNRREPWSGVSQNAQELNSALRKIYEWRGKLANKERELAQNVQGYLVKAEQLPELERVDCATMALRLAHAVKGAQPENPIIDDMMADAEKMLDKQLAAVAHLFTGPFHRSHLKQIVVFEGVVQPGQEASATVAEAIQPVTPATLIGYFQASNKDGGGVPTLTWFEMTEKYVQNRLNGMADPAPDQMQPMYTGLYVKDELEAQGHMDFALFPDPAALQYESHLQYLPHLNFVKWLTMQMPGDYSYKFTWGLRNTMAEGTVRLQLTRESRDALKAYYDQLLQKKIDTVTFPMTHCADSRGQITNVADMGKYGTLLKVSYEATGDIMYPWPRDDEVQWNTAAGWAAFEQDDGRVTVMPLEFRKTPTESRWNFHSVGFTPDDLALQGKLTVAPELLGYGYEMRKANVDVCKAW